MEQTALSPRPGQSPLLARVGLCGALFALASTGCNSSSSPSVGKNNPGEVVRDPDTGGFFIVDPSKSGEGSEVKILRAFWGRLVDVYGLDGSGSRTLMQENFLIGADLESDGFDYELETSPVTAQQTLTILRNVDDTSKGGGRDQFFQKLVQAEANVAPVFDNGLTGSFFTMVPRNSAVVIQFDDLIDASTLDDTTVRVLTGSPAVIPFEPRMMIDRNHGDLANHDGKKGVEFYTTRIIIDYTVTEVESFETDPPLPVNAVGLPASVNSNIHNVQIRIPTKTDVVIGQDHILTNPTDHAVTTANNGTVDFSSKTLDVVRAFRSGGRSGVTGDPFNGFLRDEDEPRVVGVQESNIDIPPVSTNPPPIGDGTEFLIPQMTFASEFCAQTPKIGDIVNQPGIFAEVFEDANPHQDGVVNNLRVRLLAFPSAWNEPGQDGALEWETTGGGPAQFLSPYDSQADAAKEACFVKVLPTPNGYPENPTSGVFPSSTFSVRFSEPMAPDVMSAFDAMTVTREPIADASYKYVVGAIQQSIDLQEFAFVPDLPLAHATGQMEPYYLTLVDGPTGPADLAGNRLAEPLPQVTATLELTAPPQTNGGRVTRFAAVDEEEPIGTPAQGPIPEWGGQIVFDTIRQLIRPRPVTRFEGIVDRTQLMIGAMPANPAGVQSPLSNYGSKTQILWRNYDMGIEMRDPAFHNIDVEGLNWAPFGGQVVVDTFNKFEMRLNHCFYSPDEIVSLGSPVYPNSGVVNIFENNFLNGITDPQKIVHPRFRGYQVNPGDIFTSNQDLKLLPFPLNRTVSPSQFEYYTWRNTSIQDRAGPDSWGAEPAMWWAVNGLPFPLTDAGGGDCMMMPLPNPYYRPGNVQTVGLPLLMEFRCWQYDGAIGINRFDTAVATNASTKPYFRAFSTGGIDTDFDTVIVDPDLETSSNGGFDPNSIPLPGAPTFGQDNEVYMGSADFVIRVSRAFSIWFPATDPTSPNGEGNFTSPTYFEATIEPANHSQPLKARVDVAYRGASNVDFSVASQRLHNSLEYDLYGDHYLEVPSNCDGSIHHNPNEDPYFEMNQGVAFFNSDQKWFTDPAKISGAVYYQTRLTFVANPQTGLTPEVSAFALTWAE